MCNAELHKSGILCIKTGLKCMVKTLSFYVLSTSFFRLFSVIGIRMQAIV